MAKVVRLLYSYAHKDFRAAKQLRDLLEPRLRIGKDYSVEVWQDVELLPGEDWDQTIKDALTRSEGGIVLVSPNLLASGYVVGTELPPLLQEKKLLLPLLLKPVDFSKTDMKGLENRQIFGGNQPAECRPFTKMDRDEYAYQAASKIYDRFVKEFAHAGI